MSALAMTCLRVMLDVYIRMFFDIFLTFHAADAQCSGNH